MKLLIVDDYAAMSKRAASYVEAELLHNTSCRLGLATGSTPEGMYHILCEDYQKGLLDFSRTETVNLDEYVGLAGTNEQSYRYFMNRHLFDQVNIRKSCTYLPDGSSDEPEAAAAAYEQLLQEKGPVDLQVLGIGNNGHIGFNEPGEIYAETHVTELSDSTVKANARLFEKEADVPRQALTMGMRGILSANRILLLASGKAKAHAVKQMVEGPVTPLVPASFLQLHRDVIAIMDREAASALSDIS